MNDLKSLILMPGPVSKVHADEEKQCDSCHSRFDKSAQDTLCLGCHEEVAKDRKDKAGFHGLSPSASSNNCKSCHQDHKGRDFNIAPLDKATFDHDYTDFRLQGKHADTRCTACHKKNTLYRETESECYACHKKDDPHQQTLGEECSTCHQSQSWKRRKEFDHDATEFPLLGRHQKLQCNSCHAGEQYQFETTDCASCHQVKDVHLGKYGQSCDQCHSQSKWEKLDFDHDRETDFKLTGVHRNQSCNACHFNGFDAETLSSRCTACHLGSDVHAGRHGGQCQSCHNTRRWSDTRFDHAVETNWPLAGKHKDVNCLQCHRGSLDEKLDGECQSCHGADDVHQSSRLEDCSSCHQPAGWGKTLGFDHELTVFPLEGMHAVAPCQSCHQGFVFNETKSDCVVCHKTDDIHRASLGTQCASCHNPNAWAIWSFDHNHETEFKLQGSHEGLACASCHKGNNADDVSGRCSACHAPQDRHGGRFGDNCGRCHNSESFKEVQWQN